MSAIVNSWSLITSMRLEDHAHLAAWHLWLVLLVLGVSAGFGIHYVLGYIFRFYWRAGRFQWWIALIAFPMVMLSTLALIWSYLLATGAPRLIERLLDQPEEGRAALTAEIGNYLLQPAFDRIELPSGASGPTHEALAQALLAIPQDDLRAALGAVREQEPPRPAAAEPPKANGEQGQPPGAEPGARPPATEPPRPNGGAEEPETGEPEGPVPVILEIVRDWITDPDQSWPAAEGGEAERAPGGEPGAPISPNEYILSLIGEIEVPSPLPEPDWAYIAGARFDERLLRPLLLEYLRMSALALAILIVLLNAGYFWTISRMNRPPRVKAQAAPKAAAGPASASQTPLPSGDPPRREAKAP